MKNSPNPYKSPYAKGGFTPHGIKRRRKKILECPAISAAKKAQFKKRRSK